MNHKVIIDTDPGIDDTMAIFFAFLHPQIDVIGLTSVFGNVEVEKTARNALVLAEMANQNIPVCKGAAGPFLHPKPGYAKFVHGEEGFGTVGAMEPKGQLDPRHSAQFIVDMANQYPGELVIAAIGPLTNLAIALQLDPSIVDKVKQVVIMGGAATVPGNITPVAEANIWNDAHAAKMVFEASWDTVMFGLDITNNLRFNQTFLDKLTDGNAKLGKFIDETSQFYMDFYSQDTEDRACCFHDATPLAYLVAPELFDIKLGKMVVSTDELTRGQTAFCHKDKGFRPPWDSGPYSKVALGVDKAALTQLYIDTFAG